MIALTLIIILGVLLLVFLIYRTIQEKNQFIEGNNRNPYNRYCKQCGQCQELHTESTLFEEQIYKWIPMGKIYNQDCKCHKYIN